MIGDVMINCRQVACDGAAAGAVRSGAPGRRHCVDGLQAAPSVIDHEAIMMHS